MESLPNLVGAIAAIWLIGCGLVHMINPKAGGEMLQRLVVFFAGALLGLCLLRQDAASIGWLSLLFLAGVIVITAYFMWEIRRGHPRRQRTRRGAERVPLVPPLEEKE
jgi:Ca2+/Na+ antiporter